MASDTPLSSRSDKLKKAIAWVSETDQNNPDFSRNKALNDALIRFDLSPADCEFLLKHFSEQKSSDDTVDTN